LLTRHDAGEEHVREPAVAAAAEAWCFEREAARIVRARIAGVTRPVAVGVRLVGIGDRRAVVDRVGHAVAIAVRGGRLARIADPVVVGVELGRVGRIGAVVAGVAHAVAVAVGLVGVGHGRAVVARVGDAVAVGVGQRPALADVAHAVVIAVALLGVGDRRAVVGDVGDAVAVGVGEARGVDRVDAGDRVQVEAREAAEACLDGAPVDAHGAGGVRAG